LWNLIFRPLALGDSRTSVAYRLHRLTDQDLQTTLSCSVLSVQYLTTTVSIIAISRGELDRKLEAAFVCVNIIHIILLYGHRVWDTYIYTPTVYNIMYVVTKTGERPLLHRPPPKLPARVRRWYMARENYCSTEG